MVSYFSSPTLNQRCHSSSLNRNSVFCFNPFFPGRPFIKRPEEKKGNGIFFFFFFFFFESRERNVWQHAARAAVISVALISRLIPRTPADYVYVCNERAHDEPGSSSYVYAVVVSEVITHSLEIKSMISCVGGFRSQSSYRILLHYSPGTNQVLVTWPSETRQDELSNTYVYWSDTHWNLVFVNSVKAWKEWSHSLRDNSKMGKIQGSAKNGQQLRRRLKISVFFLANAVASLLNPPQKKIKNNKK